MFIYTYTYIYIYINVYTYTSTLGPCFDKYHSCLTVFSSHH